jgi:hypothetical protein
MRNADAARAITGIPAAIVPRAGGGGQTDPPLVIVSEKLFSRSERCVMPATPDEKTRMAEAPRGAFALMLGVAALLFAGWAFLYFGRFLPNGLVH